MMENPANVQQNAASIAEANVMASKKMRALKVTAAPSGAGAGAGAATAAAVLGSVGSSRWTLKKVVTDIFTIKHAQTAESAADWLMVSDNGAFRCKIFWFWLL